MNATASGKRILIVDDDLHYLRQLCGFVSAEFPRFQVESKSSVADVLPALGADEAPWDLILADVMMPERRGGPPAVGEGGFKIAAHVEAARSAGRLLDLRMALISSADTVHYAHGARLLERFCTPANASWVLFLRKQNDESDFSPWKTAIDTLSWADGRLWDKVAITLQEKGVYYTSAGTELAIELARRLRVIETMKKMRPHVATGSPAWMIFGATGTGKESLAQAIHELSGRKGPMVPFRLGVGGMDSASVRENMLLGTVKGVFTNVEARPGLIEQAHSGTLFVDEAQLLGETQNVLLSPMQDRTVRRLGGNRLIDVDVQYVFATSVERDACGVFDDAFIGRVQGRVFELEPLKNRPADVPHILRRLLPPGRRLDDEAEQYLAQTPLDWTTNIRGVQALAERLEYNASEGQEVLTRPDLLAALQEVGVKPAGARPALPGPPAGMPPRSLPVWKPKTREEMVELWEFGRKRSDDGCTTNYTRLGELAKAFNPSIDVKNYAQVLGRRAKKLGFEPPAEQVSTRKRR